MKEMVTIAMCLPMEQIIFIDKTAKAWQSSRSYVLRKFIAEKMKQEKMNQESDEIHEITTEV